MAWVCMAARGTGSLVFIVDVTQDRSSRMNSEVYRDIVSVQIQSNAAKLIGRRFMIQIDYDQKHTAEQPRSLSKHLISTQLSMHYTYLRQNFRQKDPQTNN